MTRSILDYVKYTDLKITGHQRFWELVASKLPAGFLDDGGEGRRVWTSGSSSRPVVSEIQQQPARLSPSSPFSARLTPHITIGEFALNQEVRRFTAQHQIDTAAELAAFLERVRVRFDGRPVIITSGYRPAVINRAVGGASSSEHLYDAPDTGAVDFYINGANINAVQAWCDEQWPYSLGYGAPKGFVHLGIRQGRPRVRWVY